MRGRWHVCYGSGLSIIYIIVMKALKCKPSAHYSNIPLSGRISNGHTHTHIFCFRWRLRFIQSDFKGQLPGLYSNYSNSTSIIPDHMNDMNLEEPSRYVSIIVYECCILYEEPLLML